jgi:putative hydrolase of HD superfamily
MALVHDMAEAIVGDVTPPENSGVSKADKLSWEQGATTHMLAQLSHDSNADVVDHISALWNEYEERATATARFVKDCDTVEMLLQALDYEVAHSEIGAAVDLSDFFASTVGKCTFDQTRAWDAEVRRLRSDLREKEEGVTRGDDA